MSEQDFAVTADADENAPVEQADQDEATEHESGAAEDEQATDDDE